MEPNSYAAQGKALPPARVDGDVIQVPSSPRSLVRLSHEPPNVSQHASAQTLQNALRCAEHGNTRPLFALYRDGILGGSHMQAEFNKRKLAVIGDQMAILPADKTNPDDVLAAHVCNHAVNNCANWSKSLTHLLDSIFFPVSVVEKTFEAGGRVSLGNGRIYNLTYDLKELQPVNHTLLCFEDTGADFNAWEPFLRLYQTNTAGEILYTGATADPLDPMRHIVHRGHLMTGMRDNFGGPGRACLPWWLLSILARDWFGRAMERYGSPFPVAKCDAENETAVRFLASALSLSTKLGGLVVDNDTQVELVQAMQTNMADGYEKFLNVCNREISKVILGQTLSAEAQPTGLGSGTSALHGDVRNDICRFDRQQLAETISDQLFKPVLQINGLRGTPPTIVWGGMSTEKAASVGALLVQLSQAGLEPADASLDTIGETVGFAVQRKAAAPQPGFGGMALSSLSARNTILGEPHSDEVARAKSAALAQAYRGSLAPVREIILNSASPDEALANMTRFFRDWKPMQVLNITEEALQICAAAGAATMPGRTVKSLNAPPATMDTSITNMHTHVFPLRQI